MTRQSLIPIHGSGGRISVRCKSVRFLDIRSPEVHLIVSLSLVNFICVTDKLMQAQHVYSEAHIVAYNNVRGSGTSAGDPANSGNSMLLRISLPAYGCYIPASPPPWDSPTYAFTLRDSACESITNTLVYCLKILWKVF